MMRYIGIDPGVTGAIAHIGHDGSVDLIDIPTLVIVGKKKHTVLNLSAMRLELQKLACVDRRATFLLEAPVFGPAAKKKEQDDDGVGHSVVTLCNGFRLNGQIEGMLAIFGAMYDCAYEVINPQVWKRAMMPGEARDKDAARQKAIQLFPASAEELKRKKDHNRAEALLLAEWGRRRG